MLTCSACQFANPPDHRFCQRCGEPLPVLQADDSQQDSPDAVVPPAPAKLLQATLMPVDGYPLEPATYLDQAQRYQVLTVLTQGSALVSDTMPEQRSPLQAQLSQLTEASIETLQSLLELPPEAYPYLLLSEAAPLLYDVWQQDDVTYLITSSEQPAVASLIDAFAAAVDPLQHVYWMYTLTDLWVALEPIAEWRSSLLLANNLGIDAEQSLSIRQFIAPSGQPPTLSHLKAFLQSLLAQPHRGAIAPLRQIRQIILAVTAAETLEQLRTELAAIGESLLDTPEAITPAVSSAREDISLSAMPFIQTPTDVSQVATEADTRPAPADTDSAAVDLEDADSPEAFDSLLLEEIDLPELGELGDSTVVLPMQLVSLADAGRTDVGRQRDHNEDCFLISSASQKQSANRAQRTQAHCLYILCDGMGGHAGGEVASRLAAQTLADYFAEHWPQPASSSQPSALPTEAVIIEAVQLANQAIYEVNEKESRAGHERMGTTLVLLLLQNTEAVVAHVGDSRLYQHTRRIGLRQMTTDHEVGQREIQQGIPHDIAYGRPDAYQLTQALGPRDKEDLRPSVSYLSFSEDTLLLLCSDGLSDNDLVEDYLESHIDPLLRGKKELETGVNDLIDLANEVNGHDNISAIAIRLKVSPDMEKLRTAG